MENIVNEYVRIGKECDELCKLQDKLRLEIFTRPEAIIEYKKVYVEYSEIADIAIEMEKEYAHLEEFQRLLKLTGYEIYKF